MEPDRGYALVGWLAPVPMGLLPESQYPHLSNGERSLLGGCSSVPCAPFRVITVPPPHDDLGLRLPFPSLDSRLVLGGPQWSQYILHIVPRGSSCVCENLGVHACKVHLPCRLP